MACGLRDDLDKAGCASLAPQGERGQASQARQGGVSAAMALPTSLQAEWREEIAVLRLVRPEKRNALNDPTVEGIGEFFATLPSQAKAVVLDASGENFSAGLDLSELSERSTIEGVAHSMMWHRAFEQVELGRVPVVAVLKGAGVGGGVELAAAAPPPRARRTA